MKVRDLSEESDKSIAEQVSSNDALERYLEALENPLLGIVPADPRMSFVSEARSHLEQSIRDRLATGETLELATQHAVRLFGAPGVNADEFLESWFQYRANSGLSRRFGLANLIAYGYFQAAVLVYFIFLQICIFMPSEATYHIPWRMSPFQVRAAWPEPLPFPDFTATFFLTVGWPIVAPILVGWFVGRAVPARAGAAAYRGLMPLIVLSFVMGALLLPMIEGLLFALFEVAYWLPVGCLTAHFSSRLHGRRQRRAFEAQRNRS